MPLLLLRKDRHYSAVCAEEQDSRERNSLFVCLRILKDKPAASQYRLIICHAQCGIFQTLFPHETLQFLPLLFLHQNYFAEISITDFII